jgi:hypothetical protein
MPVQQLQLPSTSFLPLRACVSLACGCGEWSGKSKPFLWLYVSKEKKNCLQETFLFLSCSFPSKSQPWKVAACALQPLWLSSPLHSAESLHSYLWFHSSMPPAYGNIIFKHMVICYLPPKPRRPLNHLVDYSQILSRTLWFDLTFWFWDNEILSLTPF